MDSMIPLTPEEMAQANGGAAVTVRLKTIDVRSGPSLSYPVIATRSTPPAMSPAANRTPAAGI